ncbi:MULTISPECIES: hypothetical protein [Campylobacter]|uniref:hypothetical protein n=1 Tax=Campylobacter TaxID=194 RepID=UPI000A335E0F|nr:MULTISPECIES: hypothetical protein [unclassified Campylobacter]MEE3694441.1 hypothetical protein [Campylobacter sp. CLAX-22107-21]MEE3712134.1 hypothetical protein [Campylobacter sp. CLAX-7218-21]MBP3675694.1 hypothetical protein [Campylobacter sp.]MBR2148998.1 hypothetical protein [Campylobacter sp.]MBR2158946.1 hypothetical protein [Campylobacter sp.]
MKSAIIVYDGVNFLSFARIYDVFMRCGIDFVVIGFRGDARDEMGLALPMHLSSESLYGYDIVAIPGGSGADVWADDGIFLSWMNSSSQSRDIISLDNGDLILDGAGLNGRKFGYEEALVEWIKNRA